jgi:hypothetical protein
VVLQVALVKAEKVSANAAKYDEIFKRFEGD